MKKLLWIPPVLIVAAFAWFGFNWAFLPPPPAILAQRSPEVTLVFQINRMDMTEVELSLRDGRGDALFSQFSMSDEWAKGRPGLVLNYMGQSSRMGSRGKKPEEYQKDAPRESGKSFGQFMKDSQGRPVSTYAFKQALAEGRDGKLYMKMAYTGPSMPLIQSLQIPRPVEVPERIARRFIREGRIQFNAGTLYLDKEINGFWIPVTIL